MNAENKIIRRDSDREIIILAEICARIVINVRRNMVDANDKTNYYLFDGIKGIRVEEGNEKRGITCHSIRKKM